jgi:hypothetical protein
MSRAKIPSVEIEASIISDGRGKCWENGGSLGGDVTAVAVGGP